MFTVYVLYSSKHDQIYLGYSSDLENRLLSHNKLATTGHTIKYRPWVIAYTEEYPSKAEAIKIIAGQKIYLGSNSRKIQILIFNARGSYPSADGRQFDPAPRYRQKSHPPFGGWLSCSYYDLNGDMYKHYCRSTKGDVFLRII